MNNELSSYNIKEIERNFERFTSSHLLVFLLGVYLVFNIRHS